MSDAPRAPGLEPAVMGRLLSALAIFVALAALETYPLVLHLGSRIPADLGDPLLNTWILAWDLRALGRGDVRHLFDANMFFPAENALACSEHLLGVVPLFAPAALLTGNPIAGYNVVFLLSFALSGFTMFCLAYYWTRAFWPSLVAGVLFGFAPFRFGQLGHLQILNFFWAPLAMLFLDQFLRTRRWRSLAGFAAFYWLQALSSVYLAHLMTLALVVQIGCFALAGERGRGQPALFPRLLAFVVASLIVLVPPHLPYLAMQRSWGFFRTLPETLFYAPDVLSYLWAPGFMNDLYQRLLNGIPRGDTNEKTLFPGLLLPGLAVAGSIGTVASLPFVTQRRLRHLGWLIAGAAVLLSLGPYLVAFGVRTRIPMPYLLLYHGVPGFAAMRVPGRFALLAVLAASLLAALGAVRCIETLTRRVPSLARVCPTLVGVVLVILCLAELGWKPFPLVRVPGAEGVPAVYRWLAQERPGPIVELPFGLWEDFRYLYFSTVHWLPLVNGASGFYPPTYAEIREALATLPSRPALDYAAALGIRAIVVHPDRMHPDEGARWTGAGAASAGLGAPLIFGPDRVYVLPASPATRSVAAEIGTPDRLPSKSAWRLPLRLGTGALPWRHPGRQGLQRAAVHWTDPTTGRSVETAGMVQLPVVVAAGSVVDIPLDVPTPSWPAIYTMAVSVPSVGIVTIPRTVEVADVSAPTSRDAPRGLAASYRREPDDQAVTVPVGGTLHLDVVATNTGESIWLATAKRRKGDVALEWRWFQADQGVARMSGSEPLRHDVFPGQSYRFHVAAPSPDTPGDYRLELGLVSGRVTRFAQVGVPPLTVASRVQPAPRGGVAALLAPFTSQEPDAPRLLLSTVLRGARLGQALRLAVTAMTPARPWTVDAYLLLEAADGAMWFHDRERLVRYHGGVWSRLAHHVELRPGTTVSADVHLPLEGIERGRYTAHLVLTTAGDYHVVAHAETSVEILP